ncbi:uncharacterized protein LOC8281932 isoform X1 [Ricinus communis]|uniref:uncharacterized protein LOC8281932 isoform X1 n=1 Tax=Ricinus communis TaxID=3988 RepID=UPI00201A5153|nr:uncharacterized protein LOC8281932 isoform X1 [Ricinus communis]
MMVSNSISLLTIPTTTASTSNSISFRLLIPNGTLKSFSTVSQFTLRFKNNTFLSSPLPSQTTLFNFPSLSLKRCNLFSLYALKKKPRNGSTALMDMSDLEDDDDDFDDELDAFDDDFVDEGDEEEEGMLLPFGKMKKWLENKPRGFGEGKVYDTFVEDKLLEEIEQSRKAQAANLDTLKNNPVKPASEKDGQKNKVRAVAEVVPSGIRVRIINLPKKRNIHRDLQLAFKEVPGVVNIFPAVSGNKKTKDPVCKGFAFVDFKSEEDADRFVQQFSGQSIVFGRIQKQIKCMMTNGHSSNSSDDESASSFYSDSNLTVPALEADIDANADMDDSCSEETSSDVPDDMDELRTEKLKDVTDSLESFSISDSDTGDIVQAIVKPTTGSFSQKKQDKRRATKKKVRAKATAEKAPKLEIPGSAKRLKIREKAVLTDVFSKYGSQSAIASVEES